MVHFTRIGDFDDLIMNYSHSSYLTIEDKTRSVAGRIIFLANKSELKVSPICWKGKTIPQVCKSAKAAETRAVDMATDEGLFMARAVCEVFTLRKGRHQIPMVVKCDNMPVYDSLNSNKQVEEKMMRPVIQHLKDMTTRSEISHFVRIDTNYCHADVLTKANAKKCAEKVLQIFRTGENV